MAIRWLLAIGLAAAMAFGYREVRSWTSPALRAIISPRQRALRLWGLFLLLLLLGLGLGGTFIPIPNTSAGPHDPAAQRAVLIYLAYWLFASVVFLPLIPIALADARQNAARLEADMLRIQDEREQLRSLRDSTEQ